MLACEGLHGRSMESKVHETFGDVNRVNVCRLLEGPHVDDELVGHETLKKMFETVRFLSNSGIHTMAPHGASRIEFILYFLITLYKMSRVITVYARVEPGPLPPPTSPQNFFSYICLNLFLNMAFISGEREICSRINELCLDKNDLKSICDR